MKRITEIGKIVEKAIKTLSELSIQGKKRPKKQKSDKGAPTPVEKPRKEMQETQEKRQTININPIETVHTESLPTKEAYARDKRSLIRLAIKDKKEETAKPAKG